MGIYFNRLEQGTALYPLVLDLLTALLYCERWISSIVLSVVVPPSHRKFLSVTELATPLGKFLVVFHWGLGAQCVLFLLSVSPCFCVAFYSMFIH